MAYNLAGKPVDRPGRFALYGGRFGSTWRTLRGTSRSLTICLETSGSWQFWGAGLLTRQPWKARVLHGRSKLYVQGLSWAVLARRRQMASLISSWRWSGSRPARKMSSSLQARVGHESVLVRERKLRPLPTVVFARIEASGARLSSIHSTDFINVGKQTGFRPGDFIHLTYC